MLFDCAWISRYNAIDQQLSARCTRPIIECAELWFYLHATNDILCGNFGVETIPQFIGSSRFFCFAQLVQMILRTRSILFVHVTTFINRCIERIHFGAVGRWISATCSVDAFVAFFIQCSRKQCIFSLPTSASGEMWVVAFSLFCRSQVSVQLNGG